MLLLAAVCAGGDGESDQTLERLRKVVVDEAKRIPNYTCVQTIDRQFYVPAAPGSYIAPPGPYAAGPGPNLAPPMFRSCAELAAANRKKPLRLIPGSGDRFRLDVRVGAGGEMYSWVGANRFGDRSLREFLGPGPSTTGAFGPMLIDAVADAPEFKFEGETTLEGRQVSGYYFHVPVERSHHEFLTRDGSLTTIAYEGTIFADPATGAPVRLNVRAVDLPAETECCRYSTTLDYSRVRIGDGEFPLPKTADQRFAMSGGGEAENTVTFSACREYVAESAVAFQGTPPQTPAASDGDALPAVIALSGMIDSAVSAAGDPFTGRLVKPVVDKRKQAIVPEGATVQGRIARFVQYRTGGTVYLEIETVEIGGREVPFHVRRKPLPTSRRPPAGALQTRGVTIGEFPQTYWDYVMVSKPGSRWVIPDGFRTDWVTVGQP